MYRDNLKRYWREHTAHVSIGAFAGPLATTLDEPVAAGLVMGMVGIRQTLEYLKRDDTPGIDLAYYIGGLLAGVAAGAFVL